VVTSSAVNDQSEGRSVLSSQTPRRFTQYCVQFSARRADTARMVRLVRLSYDTE
jgi:hypothetical protein